MNKMALSRILANQFGAHLQDLKGVMSKKVIEHQKKVNKLRKEFGQKVIGQVTIDQIYGGMRGVPGLVTETSHVDPEEGIRYRGLTLKECQERLPRAPGGEAPLPEGMFWLLMTGDVPTKEQADSVSRSWAGLSELPPHVTEVLSRLPTHLHPAAQLSAALTACATESKFARELARGVSKENYWELTFDDSMSLIAKLPRIAAVIFSNLYHDGSGICAVDLEKDWACNFTSALGRDEQQFTEFVRSYLAFNSDYDGANVIAHTTHLVGSALSDPFLSFAAGVNGYAGPLHGGAMQETQVWLEKLQKEVGADITDDKIKDFITKTLARGQVVPGYGHAFLRKADPRVLAMLDFGLRHLPNDPAFRLVQDLHRLAPPILREVKKMKNPSPNADSINGVLIKHFNLDPGYFLVFSCVGRVLGVATSLVWSRAMGLPIVRPDCHTTQGLMEMVGAA